MDLRIAFRSLRRSPGFTFLAVVMLALGIGANTAVFSVVYAVLLRPLNYRNPDRIVSINNTFKSAVGFGQISGPDFLDISHRATAFQSLAAYDSGIEGVVTNGSAELSGVAGVSKDFLATIGIDPLQGRGFTATDYLARTPAVALVSAGFWDRHFGNTAFAPGRTLKMEDLVLDIVGILPAGFHFPDGAQTQVWIPITNDLGREDRSAHNFRVIGRLKPGVTLSQARAQLTAIASELQREYPASNKDEGLFVTRLVDFNVRGVKSLLYTLFGAVALVLLIACANVANLLLARGTVRLREIAIRAALGAGKARIARQLFIENLVLAGAGCLAGVLLAEFALPVLLTMTPEYVPRIQNAGIDLPVLLFCAGAAFLASVLFGMAPVWKASRINPNEGLRVGGSHGIVGGAAGKLRQAIVTAEIALCLILLVSAGLLLTSFSNLINVNLGFRPEQLLVAEINVPAGPQQANQRVFTPLLERLSNVPGVQSAALTRTLPGETDTRSWGGYIVSGQTMSALQNGGPQAGFSVISPDYFRTLRIPLIAGRVFTARDNVAAEPVAIINETLARQSFPRQNPIGQTILCGMDSASMKWMKIVGVVADTRMDGPAQTPRPEIYMPYLQHPRSDFHLVLRAGVFGNQLREIVRQLDPDASLKITTMESHLASVLSAPRFSSTLVGIFAGLALLLAVIGIYGTVSYSVAQRTAELGLRVALGADRTSIIGLVLRQSVKFTVLGLLFGIAGAALATRVLQSQLFGISSSDPLTYTLTFAFLAAVSLAAGYLPAWRACRIDPMQALRQE